MKKYPFNEKPDIPWIDTGLPDREEIFRRFMDELMPSESEEGEELTVDTFGCDELFLRFFVTDRMREDFPLITRDFLLHELPNIGDHEMVSYLDTDPRRNYPEQLFERLVLNLMMNAVNSGSQYTKNLFLYLYKVYYHKEYQSLKRFRKLSRGDVLTLAKKGEHISFVTVARILSIARIYGIELSRDCDRLFIQLSDDLRDDEISETDFKFSGEVYRSYRECLADAMKIFDDDDEMFSMYYDHMKFVENVLRSENCIEDLVDLCDDEDSGILIGIGRSLSVLRKTYPDREFSKEELIRYAVLYHSVSALICSLETMEDWMDGLFSGDVGRSCFKETKPLFKAEDVMNSWPGASIALKKKTEKPETIKEEEENGKTTESALLAEIEALQRKVHMYEGNISSLKSELSEKRKISDENVNLNEQLRQQNRELAALREHLYNMTEEDEIEDTIPVSEMKDYLRPLRIIIAGGHSNWVNKMKKDFPDWVYINPTVSGTLEASVVDKADHVYFFTDTISHSTYFRYMNVVKDHDVAFGYIHGVNIENTVRQMYRELKESL